AEAPSAEPSLSTPTVVEAIRTYIRMIALPIFLFPPIQDPPPLPNLSSKFDADGDIIELDFEETSGLSDMNAFNKAQKKGEEKKLSSRNGPVNSSGLESSLLLTTNGKAKGQKKTRKEKEVEKREQIENSCSGMRQLLFPILFLVPTSGLRRLSSEQMYISNNLDVHIVTICHEHGRSS
ncbi:hypothetical protein M378DRAFT_171782, partial [Amanita muscaria Koide BX008]